MKIFNNFEDWPKPVEIKPQARGQVMSKENEKEEKGLKRNKNKKMSDDDFLKDGEATKSRYSKKAAPTEYSPEAIREKVEISKNMKDVSKNMKSDRVSSSIPDIAVRNFENEGSNLDLNKNDPTDPATIGKLKDLLNKGGVTFSERDRQVISKIIEE